MKFINKNFIIAFAILLTGCHASSEDDIKKILEIEKSLINSNATINHFTQSLMKEFEEGITEWCTRETALFWYPKAQNVISVSKELYDYIDGIKRGKSFNSKVSDSLYYRIENTKANLAKIDSSIQTDFPHEFLMTTFGFPGDEYSKEDFYKNLFKNNSPEMTEIILSRIQNHLRLLENSLVNFFKTKSSCNIFWFETYSIP